MGNTGDIQLWEFLYACGFGFWLGAYYELFRMVRLLLPPSAVSCFFQDVLFFGSGSIMVFFIFLGIADGQIFPYLLLGVAVGFLSFYYTFGRFLHILLAKTVRQMMRICCVFHRWIQPINRKATIKVLKLHNGIYRKLCLTKVKKPKKFKKKRKNS